VLVGDGDCICVGRDIASGVAQLSDGEECVGGQVRDDADLASSSREIGNVQIGDMCGVHDAAVVVVDGKRSGCEPFVDNRERCCAKMGCATSVGNDGKMGGWLELSKLVEETC
jgi:hypothetical protein